MSVSTDQRPRIVAVTACPTGIAHSQMAAEALSQAADEGGYEISIEVQGAMGTEGELTPDDLRRADVAVVAADVTVDTERFEDLPVVNVPVSEAVTDADSLLDRAATAADRSDTDDAATAAEADEAAAERSPDEAPSADDDRDDGPAGLFDRLRRRFR